MNVVRLVQLSMFSGFFQYFSPGRWAVRCGRFRACGSLLRSGSSGLGNLGDSLSGVKRCQLHTTLVPQNGENQEVQEQEIYEHSSRPQSACCAPEPKTPHTKDRKGTRSGSFAQSREPLDIRVKHSERRCWKVCFVDRKGKGGGAGARSVDDTYQYHGKPHRWQP